MRNSFGEGPLILPCFFSVFLFPLMTYNDRRGKGQGSGEEETQASLPAAKQRRCYEREVEKGWTSQKSLHAMGPMRCLHCARG